MKAIGKKVDLKKLKLKPVELEKMPLPKLKMLQPEQLKVMYRAKKVPELRFNFKKINDVAMKIKKTPSLKAKYTADPKYKNIMKYTKFIYLPKPSINYEQLTCVGLNYNRDMLEATLSIKRPYGYSGELCKARGSYEYVAFWIYYRNPRTGKCKWKYVGTGRVNVHDIKKIPRGGLHYAVYAPFDFSGIKKILKEDLCQNLQDFSDYRA